MTKAEVKLSEIAASVLVVSPTSVPRVAKLSLTITKSDLILSSISCRSYIGIGAPRPCVCDTERCSPALHPVCLLKKRDLQPIHTVSQCFDGAERRQPQLDALSSRRLKTDQSRLWSRNPCSVVRTSGNEAFVAVMFWMEVTQSTRVINSVMIVNTWLAGMSLSSLTSSSNATLNCILRPAPL